MRFFLGTHNTQSSPSNRPRRSRGGVEIQFYSFLNLGADGVSGQRHALAALPPARPGTHCIGGWVGTRAGLHGCGIRSPDCSDRSESLYRLSYPGPRTTRKRNEVPFRLSHVCECIWKYANLDSRTSALILIRSELHRMYTIVQPSMVFLKLATEHTYFVLVSI
jgi:hypothetical protein